MRKKRVNPNIKTIRKKLIDADLRVTDLAREFGCRPQTVSQIIIGSRRSRRLQIFIEKKLAVHRGELFPELVLKDRDDVS